METGISAVAGATNLNEQQVNYNSTVAAQAQFVDENAKAREVRPTEEAGDSAKAKAETQSQTTTKTTIENKTDIVFTRYDSEGKEISRVPPELNTSG
jgi:hypothetical protein